MNPGARAFVLVVGIAGAIVGGVWLGPSVSVLLGPRGLAQNLVVAVTALFLLGAIAIEIEDAGGRHALGASSLTAATAMATVFLIS